MKKTKFLVCSGLLFSFAFFISMAADDKNERKERSERRMDKKNRNDARNSDGDRKRERNDERRKEREVRRGDWSGENKNREPRNKGENRWNRFRQRDSNEPVNKERRRNVTNWGDQNRFQKRSEREARRSVQEFLQNHPSTENKRNRWRSWQNRQDDNRRRNWEHSRRDRGSWKYNDTKAQDLARTTRSDFWRKYSDRRQKWFNKKFWASRRHHPVFYNYNYNWWNVASAGALSAWLGWQARPYFYSYAQGYWGPTYYADSYYSSSDYTQRAQLIDSYQSQNQQWLPLGVFALVDTVNSAEPNIYLQLAVNKEGFIAGTFYNAMTDQSYDLEGVVQKSSQRAAWKIDNRADSPIFETGIYNLSNSQQPLRLYFPDGSVRNLLMVRLGDNSDGQR